MMIKQIWWHWWEWRCFAGKKPKEEPKPEPPPPTDEEEKDDGEMCDNEALLSLAMKPSETQHSCCSKLELCVKDHGSSCCVTVDGIGMEADQKMHWRLPERDGWCSKTKTSVRPTRIMHQAAICTQPHFYCWSVGHQAVEWLPMSAWMTAYWLMIKKKNSNINCFPLGLECHIF